MAERTIEIEFKGISDVETSLERCIALAERFREIWGDLPRPDGMGSMDVKPGDVLVLRYDEVLDADEVHQLKRLGSSLFPGVDAVVFSGGVRLDAVLKG